MHANVCMLIYLYSDLKGTYPLDNQITIKIRQIIESSLQTKVLKLYLYT